jgi:N-acyl-D-amino-acid deacylase
VTTIAEPARPAFDLVIAGGLVLDGLGAPEIRADVGITDGRIAAIGDLARATASGRIDAVGRVVAPGFVDIHSHSDFTLLIDPSADSAIAQGVTTEVVGNCGHGCAPIGLETDARFTANIYGWGPGVRPIDWRTVGGYLRALDDTRPAINVGTLAPLGNLRLMVLDDVRDPADEADARRMSRLLEEALDDGALGLSSGLEYPAEHAASRDELDTLCRRVAARERLYATHTRDRGRAVVEGTVEGIEMARRTGVRTQVSHVLARSGSGPAGANGQIAALLEAAATSMSIAWDVHTRLFGITNLSTAISPDVMRMRAEELPAALRHPASLRVGRDDDTVIAAFGRAGWDRTYILEAGARHADLATRSVAEVAAVTGLQPAEVLLAVLHDAAEAGDVHRPMAIATTYTESDIADAIRTSRCAVGSDATTMRLASSLWPRMLPGAFTWAAWFLRRMVGEWHVLPLPEAIRRITSLPAQQAGLVDRGVLRPGAHADVVVVDPASIREPMDLIHPASYATGVDHVLVNGVSTWDHGRPTGERAGAVLRG